MRFTILILMLLILDTISGQDIIKPVGCFAGTNGTNINVLTHPEARGVLLTERWSTIESSPGIFDYSSLDNKITTVKNQGLKYALAVPAGAFGSPSWLVDSLNADSFNYNYQGNVQILAKWWDSIVEDRLNTLITNLGNKYASDSLLSHVYVTQMTSNGVEGHLNGVVMNDFINAGYNDSLWISSAIKTTDKFISAFPNIPIVFEVHEINHDTLVPSEIMNHFKNETATCNRVGLGMWWISGKTTYQTDLLEYIDNYDGDKYAQVIGRSDQTYRFKDSSYATVFTQAKQLGIRYIEPWPYEFQHSTHDSLISDFNEWADLNFDSIYTCNESTNVEDYFNSENQIQFEVYPNPSQGVFNIEFKEDINTFDVLVYNSIGYKLFEGKNKTKLNLNKFSSGVYIVKINTNKGELFKRIIIE